MLVKIDADLHQMVSGSLAFLDSLAKKSENFPYKHKVVDILVLWVKQSQLQFSTSVLVVQKQPQKRYKKMSVTLTQ